MQSNKLSPLDYGTVGGERSVIKKEKLQKDEKMKQVEEKTDNYIVVLDNPTHRYHGNHWFHVAEHFLAHSADFQQRLHGLSAGHLFLVSNNQKLLSMMTSFTFFLLILTFWHPKILSISLMEQSPTLFGFSTKKISENMFIGNVYKMSAKFTKFRYQPTSHIYDRFSIPSLPESGTLTEFSGYYLGSFGEFPIASSKWFHSQSEIDPFRSKLSSICQGSDAFEEHAAIHRQEQFMKERSFNPKKRRLIVSQRDQTRRFLNFDHLLHQIQSFLPFEWELIPVLHNEERNPCFLYHLLHQAHGFLSLHGFQLTCKCSEPL